MEVTLKIPRLDCLPKLVAPRELTGVVVRALIGVLVGSAAVGIGFVFVDEFGSRGGILLRWKPIVIFSNA